MGCFSSFEPAPPIRPDSGSSMPAGREIPLDGIPLPLFGPNRTSGGRGVRYRLGLTFPSVRPARGGSGRGREQHKNRGLVGPHFRPFQRPGLRGLPFAVSTAGKGPLGADPAVFRLPRVWTISEQIAAGSSRKLRSARAAHPEKSDRPAPAHLFCRSRQSRAAN